MTDANCSLTINGAGRVGDASSPPPETGANSIVKRGNAIVCGSCASSSLRTYELLLIDACLHVIRVVDGEVLVDEPGLVCFHSAPRGLCRGLHPNWVLHGKARLSMSIDATQSRNNSEPKCWTTQTQRARQLLVTSCSEHSRQRASLIKEASQL